MSDQNQNQIEGLPAGAVIGPSLQTPQPQIDGLPPGAIIGPALQTQAQTPLTESDAASGAFANQQASQQTKNTSMESAATGQGIGGASAFTQGGYGVPGSLLAPIGTPERNDATKIAGVMAGATLAPTLLPELTGTVAGVAARTVASGTGAAVGNSVGQTVTGLNPFTLDSLKESGKIGLVQT